MLLFTKAFSCALNFVDQRLHRDLGLGGGSLVIGRRLDFHLVSGSSPVSLAAEQNGEQHQNHERNNAS